MPACCLQEGRHTLVSRPAEARFAHVQLQQMKADAQRKAFPTLPTKRHGIYWDFRTGRLFTVRREGLNSRRIREGERVSSREFQEQR